MEVLLDVRGLRTQFHTKAGVVRAVDGVSWNVRKGETVALVGESGCGKSVSALSVMRLVSAPAGRIVEGEILFKGRNLLALPEEEMRKVRGREIGMIFQEPMTSLNPVLTVGRQLTEPLEIHLGMTRAQAHARAIELLSLVGLEPAYDDVEVEAVAAVRRVREQRAVVRDVRRAVDVTRIHDQRLALEVELRPLVPALVDLEQQPVVRQELALDGLGVVRQLLELAALDWQPVELARPRQVGGHEQPGAVARPRERIGLPQLEQHPQIPHGRRLSRAPRPESRRARG
jgi:ABC-type antimicrobial peptide transport system ATPase subunit